MRLAKELREVQLFKEDNEKDRRREKRRKNNPSDAEDAAERLEVLTFQ